MQTNGRYHIQDTDHIYYSADVINTSNEYKPLGIEDELEANIMEDPSEWYISVIKFQLPLGSLPIKIFPTSTIDKNTEHGRDITGLSNNDFYSITIKTSTEEFTEPVIHIGYTDRPNSLTAYNFSHISDDINQAIYNCCQKFTPPITDCPYFVFDVQRVGYYIVFPKNNFGVNNGQARFFMNQRLYLLFDNFPEIFSNNNPDSKRFEIIIKDYGNNTLTEADSRPPSTAYPAYNMMGTSQDSLIIYPQFKNLGKMCDIRNIYFVSNTMGSKNQVSSGIFDLKNGQRKANQFFNLPIITEFNLNLDSNDALNVRAIQSFDGYASEYRLIDILSTSPQKTIDLKVYFTDYLGKNYKVYLSPRDYFKVSLMFRRKRFSRNLD